MTNRTIVITVASRLVTVRVVTIFRQLVSWELMNRATVSTIFRSSTDSIKVLIVPFVDRKA